MKIETTIGIILAAAISLEIVIRKFKKSKKKIKVSEQ
tara:strand:+ start:514 stop:624 length:111 start_codon:yes stop_codon:yes gene_type:complete